MGVLEHNNRLDYGSLLMPDDGWKTSWAIGTTYSLDLEVLMGVPLALFHGKYLSEKTDVRNLRVDMLDALNKVKDRMFIFVHENNISANCGFSMLMSFLDQNIWNIELDSASKNFHPKVWLVRYEKNDSEATFKYRLVVMSRNMTSATDFDIAVAMDSYITKPHAENDSLLEMLSALMNRTDQKKIMEQMKAELKTIRFKPPSPFESKRPYFYPHTFKSLKCPLIEEGRYEELLVISPFVDNGALDMLAQKTDSKPILVSREYEMDKCDPAVLEKWDCYQWNSMLDEASDYEENEVGEDENKSFGISLHAKIFIAKATLGRDWLPWNNWFIGSTNCTQAGLRTNYEALVLLRSNGEGTSPKEVLNTLLNPDAPLITKYTLKESPLYKEETNKQQEMRKIVYAVSHLPFKAALRKDEHNKYITEVSVDGMKLKDFKSQYPKVKITMQLFASDFDTWVVTGESFHQFKSLYCQLLSPFVRITIEALDDKKSFLFRLPLDMPVERHGRVMGELLDSEEKLMRYLMFLLDPLMDKEQQKVGSKEQKHYGGEKEDDVYKEFYLPIYERLLLAASRDHKALAEIDKNINRLKDVKGSDGKPLISKTFKDMWKLFSIYTK